MAHYITGLIGAREVLKHLDGPFAGQPCFALELDFAFVPLDAENLDSITGLHDGKSAADFVFLTARLIELLRVASAPRGAFAYIETEYFGGIGGQGAAVFWDGAMVGAPDWREGDAINDALWELGIPPGTATLDAFAAVGLPMFRSNQRYRGHGTIA